MQISASTIPVASAPLVQQPTTLDAVFESLRCGRIDAALDDLFDDLSLRREEEPDAWTDCARGCLNHPLRALLHQDPFTYRAFSKPRGYAGDAVMMDYIYGLGEATAAGESATPLGRAIFSYMGTRPSARAVRYRRRLLADLIDHTVSAGGDRVLALAAGHLREVEMSAAMRAGRVKEFVALDQDEASLSVVTRDYAHRGVRTIGASIRHILSGRLDPGQFDFVYAAGLFDYLDGPTAAALTRRMFEMTRPGGSVLIPNFRAGARDTGYMEAFMDWRLIYRTHSDMRALASVLPPDAVASCDIFDDDDETITFLLISKVR